MIKLQEICKKIGNFLRPIFGWGIYVCLFTGGLTFFGYVLALIIGGETATTICLFLHKTLMPIIIKTSTVMVVLGLVIMYLCGEQSLSAKKKK